MNGDQQSSLPRQPIPQVKKHINIEPNEWRTSSPELCADVSVGSLLNDLNAISSGTMGDINNLNKYAHNYDSIYSEYQLESVDIPAIAKKVQSPIANNQRNISPISSQSSAAADNHALMHQIVPPRTKITHELSQNRPYRSNFPNIFADNFNGGNEKGQSMRQLSNSPNRLASTSNSNNEESMETSGTKATGNENDNNNSFGIQQRPMRHKKATEIMLAPQFLNDSTVYFDWESPEQSAYRLKMRKHSDKRHIAITDENEDDGHDLTCNRDEYRIPSDIDSQVSALYRLLRIVRLVSAKIARFFFFKFMQLNFFL